MAQKREIKRTKRAKDTLLWDFFIEKLLENMNGYVMVASSRGSVVFANRMYLDHFRFSKKNIAGKNWITSIIPEPGRKAARKVFGDLKQKKTLALFDIPVLGPGDKGGYIRWVAVPLRKKRASFYMFIGRDGKCPAKLPVKVHVVTPGRFKASYRGLVEALFASSMISEPSTAEHAARVMLFSVLLAEEMKLGRERVERLKVASLLHDLGKLLVDEKILSKKGKLTRREFEEIKKHPHWGAEVVKLVSLLHDIVPIMVNHHENYDGSGYPRGIKGKKIPLEARILSVADIYEALTADRPYRRGFSRKDAITIMEGEKGRKLDPEITDVFFKMIKKKRFK
ncbi:MAG: HD domain-containing protein [Candidatus Omnitrophota bacterium]|nr:HD domain-containing protein [Candidatus Omnitrophota bacterium]